MPGWEYCGTLPALRSLTRTILNKEALVKVRSSLRALKQAPGAQVVRRRGKTMVINKLHPRLKARQG